MGGLVSLFAEMFTREYMATNDEVRQQLVSQLTLPLDALYEVLTHSIMYQPARLQIYSISLYSVVLCIVTGGQEAEL